jgi:hypothetical protein
VLPPLPPIEVDLGGDEDQNYAAREARHLTMARRNSLTTVVTDAWEKGKRATTIDEEERHVRRAKCASIRPEMVMHGFVIVDYYDSTDFSNDDTDKEE